MESAKRTICELDDSPNKQMKSAHDVTPYEAALQSHNDAGEYLLDPANERFVLFPIREEKLWKRYKQAENCVWKVEEVDLSDDINDWNNKLNDPQRKLLKHILAFFAVADGIVNHNLLERFSRDVTVLEAKYFYGQQVQIENVHAEMYSLLIDSYIPDEAEKTHLLNSMHTIPSIKRMAEWAFRWINNKNISFAARVVAFAAVEGLLFPGCFAVIYYFKKKGLLPGLTFSNELIARDESLHCSFACLLYREYIKNKLPEATVIQLIEEAAQLSKDFFGEALPEPIIGINSVEMNKYIEFTADFILKQLGLKKHYKTKNPFSFMEHISMNQKTNFFEKKNAEYQRFSAN
jgi:ribonucleotide reductase beta subunit family protein with ferritin-like domain